MKKLLKIFSIAVISLGILVFTFILFFDVDFNKTNNVTIENSAIIGYKKVVTKDFTLAVPKSWRYIGTTMHCPLGDPGMFFTGNGFVYFEVTLKYNAGPCQNLFGNYCIDSSETDIHLYSIEKQKNMVLRFMEEPNPKLYQLLAEGISEFEIVNSGTWFEQN